MGRAVEQLPEDIDVELLHTLQRRRTFMEAAAWEQTGDVQLLLDARERLYAQIASFRKRTPHLEPARAEAMLGELFEQLYAVEQRIDPLLHDSQEVEESHTAALMKVADVPPDRVDIQRVGSQGNFDDGEVRELRVRTQRQERLDDPEVQARFRSDFAAPGPYLTRPTIDLVHGPRGLVRVLDAKSPTGTNARPQARRFVHSHQEALARCYDAAFARDPIIGLQLTVEVTLDGGEVRGAAVDRGALIDREGNRCLEQTLVEARAFDHREDTGTLSLRLLFFHEQAVYIVGATGEFISPGQSPTKPIPPDFVDTMQSPNMGDSAPKGGQ
jgi:chorismate mutase